jgi:hypothetical protein
MFYIDGVNNDTLSVSIASNASTVTRNVSMDCYDGHTFSLGVAVTGAVIEFRHSTDVSWTAIETTPYDLSPFATESQPVEFQLRFDPESVTLQELKFRKGPATPVESYTFVYNDDGDEIFNDDSDLVRTLA